MKDNPLKIRQVHHIELYVGNAKQADYYYRNAFGFDRIARQAPLPERNVI